MLEILTKHDVKYENIQVDKIIDGNEKITLGLVWTILHHFDVVNALPQSMVDDIPQAQPADVLLGWAKAVTYEYVLTITNFSWSWQNGEVFAAILIESGHLSTSWSDIKAMKVTDRLELVFSTAERELNVDQILDIDDMLENPDSNSIQLYVSHLYKKLPDLLKEKKQDGSAGWKTAIKSILAFRTPNHDDLASKIHEISQKLSSLRIELESVEEYASDITTRVAAEEKLEILSGKGGELNELKLEINDLKRNNSKDEILKIENVTQQLRNVFILI